MMYDENVYFYENFVLNGIVTMIAHESNYSGVKKIKRKENQSTLMILNLQLFRVDQNNAR